MNLFIGSMRSICGPTTLVRWEFIRGARRISCQVDQVPSASASAAFAVSLVPSWTAERGKREPFDALPAALFRHAALVSELRATGWKLLEYTA